MPRHSPSRVSETDDVPDALTLAAWGIHPVGSDGRKSATVLFSRGGLALDKSDWRRQVFEQQDQDAVTEGEVAEERPQER